MRVTPAARNTAQDPTIATNMKRKRGAQSSRLRLT